jgi:hypothetical protein
MVVRKKGKKKEKKEKKEKKRKRRQQTQMAYVCSPPVPYTGDDIVGHLHERLAEMDKRALVMAAEKDGDGPLAALRSKFAALTSRPVTEDVAPLDSRAVAVWYQDAVRLLRDVMATAVTLPPPANDANGDAMYAVDFEAARALARFKQGMMVAALANPLAYSKNARDRAMPPAHVAQFIQMVPGYERGVAKSIMNDIRVNCTTWTENDGPPTEAVVDALPNGYCIIDTSINENERDPEIHVRACRVSTDGVAYTYPFYCNYKTVGAEPNAGSQRQEEWHKNGTGETKNYRTSFRPHVDIVVDVHIWVTDNTERPE